MKIIECPRDAMQGIETFIETDTKIAYLDQLLKVGFDTIDIGSFVSPKAIPQLRDTKEVLSKLDFSSSPSKLLTIVGNERGANDAVEFDEVTYLGFPFSISETFQKRNINSTVEESFDRAKRIQEIASRNNKQLVVYISMAFGNPYDDPWDKDVVLEWCQRIVEELGVDVISLSDTIGVAQPQTLDYLFSHLIPQVSEAEIGAHLHTTPDTWKEKIESAYNAGCRRFDGAIRGFGGCPMATDKLTGNMPTENLIWFMQEHLIDHGLDLEEFGKAENMATGVFPG